MALTKNKIKLYAAEVTNPDETAFLPPSLKRLAERTGGGHAALSVVRDVPDQVLALTDEIEKAVLVPADPEAVIDILVKRTINLHNTLKTGEFMYLMPKLLSFQSQKFKLEENTVVTVDLRKRSTVSIHLAVPKRSGPVLTILGPANQTIVIVDEWAMPSKDMRGIHIYTHEFNEAVRD